VNRFERLALTREQVEELDTLVDQKVELLEQVSGMNELTFRFHLTDVVEGQASQASIRIDVSYSQSSVLDRLITFLLRCEGDQKIICRVGLTVSKVKGTNAIWVLYKPSVKCDHGLKELVEFFQNFKLPVITEEMSNE
jgi:hypothetical protein